MPSKSQGTGVSRARTAGAEAQRWEGSGRSRNENSWGLMVVSRARGREYHGEMRPSPRDEWRGFESGFSRWQTATKKFISRVTGSGERLKKIHLGAYAEWCGGTGDEASK